VREKKRTNWIVVSGGEKDRRGQCGHGTTGSYGFIQGLPGRRSRDGQVGDIQQRLEYRYVTEGDEVANLYVILVEGRDAFDLEVALHVVRVDVGQHFSHKAGVRQAWHDRAVIFLPSMWPW